MVFQFCLFLRSPHLPLSPLYFLSFFTSRHPQRLESLSPIPNFQEADSVHPLPNYLLWGRGQTIIWSTARSSGCEGTDCLLRRNVGTKMKWPVEEMTGLSSKNTWQRKSLPLVQVCKTNHISNSELKSFNWNWYVFQEIKINLFTVRTYN